MPGLGDQVPVRMGDGVELGLLNGFVEAAVQGVQDIHDGDEGGGGGSRLDGDAPRKPWCDNLHDLGGWVGSGHREVGVVDADPVWVRWPGNVKTNTLGVGKKIMK